MQLQIAKNQINGREFVAHMEDSQMHDCQHFVRWLWEEMQAPANPNLKQEMTEKDVIPMTKFILDALQMQQLLMLQRFLEKGV